MKKSSHFGSQVKDIFYESKDIYEHETENKINHIDGKHTSLSQWCTITLRSSHAIMLGTFTICAILACILF